MESKNLESKNLESKNLESKKDLRTANRLVFVSIYPRKDDKRYLTISENNGDLYGTLISSTSIIYSDLSMQQAHEDLLVFQNGLVELIVDNEHATMKTISDNREFAKYGVLINESSFESSFESSNSTKCSESNKLDKPTKSKILHVQVMVYGDNRWFKFRINPTVTISDILTHFKRDPYEYGLFLKDEEYPMIGLLDSYFDRSNDLICYIQSLK